MILLLQHVPCCVTDQWHPHPADDWQESRGFEGNGDEPARDFDYQKEGPPFGGPFHPPHEDERQFPLRRRPPGPDFYSDEQRPGPEMEHFRPPGPEVEHFGQPGPEVEHFGQPGPEVERFGLPPPSQGGGPLGMPSLLDIKVKPPEFLSAPAPPSVNLKRGAEFMEGNFHDAELPHRFGPPPEKVPPNCGPGNDMWPGENLPPMGPGRGTRPFRGGHGPGAPRGRGMRGVRGR